MMNLSHWSLKVGKFNILTSLDGVVFNLDRAETVHVCAKTRSFEAPWLPAIDFEIRQHLISSP